jgi:hypothetical protein
VVTPELLCEQDGCDRLHHAFVRWGTFEPLKKCEGRYCKEHLLELWKKISPLCSAALAHWTQFAAGDTDEPISLPGMTPEQIQLAVDLTLAQSAEPDVGTIFSDRMSMGRPRFIEMRTE